MYCPSCEQRMEPAGPWCDLCGFTLDRVDQRYGSEEVSMDQITDTTHFLRSDDKDQLVEAIDEFETQFPQFFPAFYLVELSRESVITEFSLWLLNRARVPTLDGRAFRESANAFLFVIDLGRQVMTVAPGYFAEQCVSENDLRELLRDASPYLEAGDLTEGLCKLVDDLRLILRRNHRLLLKSAKWGLIASSKQTDRRE